MAEKHEQWIAQCGRGYKDDVEKATQFEMFKKNVEFIESFNIEGTRCYKLSVMNLLIWKNEEFRASHNGYKTSFQKESTGAAGFKYENVTTVPTSMDWRKKRAGAGVKD